MKNNFDMIVGLGGFIVGFIGIGYAIGARKRMNDICAKIDKSLDEISNGMEIDIPQSVIDKAVDKAVDREVGKAVEKAATTAANDVKQDIYKEVKQAVNESYSDVKASVTEELRRQVAKVDISEARREVIREAKETAADKFDSNLNDILEKFNGDLNNISFIYKSIANAITKDNDKNITLKLT